MTTSTDETPWVEPYTGPSAQAIRERAEGLATTATNRARTWRDWAGALDRLVEAMPALHTVAYVDDMFETAAVDLGIDHIDPVQMRDTLNRVRSAADALAMAYRRGARKSALLSRDAVAVAEQLTAGGGPE